jgi:hypothetical protein
MKKIKKKFTLQKRKKESKIVIKRIKKIPKIRRINQDILNSMEVKKK